MRDKLIILVGKDGRPSMKGVYSKLKSKSELYVRRVIQTKKGTTVQPRVCGEQLYLQTGTGPPSGSVPRGTQGEVSS